MFISVMLYILACSVDLMIKLDPLTIFKWVLKINTVNTAVTIFKNIMMYGIFWLIVVANQGGTMAPSAL